MRKNFTPEQMLHTVRQAESGTPVAEVCRKLRYSRLLLTSHGIRLAHTLIREDYEDASQMNQTHVIKQASNP